MKYVADNQIIKILAQNPKELMQNAFIADPDNQLYLRWPALLEYLGLGSLLTTLPTFEPAQPLFNACVTTLSSNKEKEVCFYIYDQIFTECLNQIKMLPQMNAPYLIEAIKKSRLTPSFLTAEKIISSSLSAYEIALISHGAAAIHDLVLYLAWDRMCVCMGHLFDYQTAEPKFNKGLIILKECLIESYLHISQHEKTSPNLSRMIESLLFYHVREDNLQNHTDKGWETLSKSLPHLNPQNELADIYYIDDALVPESDDNQVYLTLEEAAKVNVKLELAQYIFEKLKEEDSQWDYTFQPKKVIFIAK